MQIKRKNRKEYCFQIIWYKSNFIEINILLKQSENITESESKNGQSGILLATCICQTVWQYKPSFIVRHQSKPLFHFPLQLASPKANSFCLVRASTFDSISPWLQSKTPNFQMARTVQQKSKVSVTITVYHYPNFPRRLQWHTKNLQWIWGNWGG